MFIKTIRRLFRKRWQLYLYYNGICIKRLKIDNIEDIKPMSINILGHKELFRRSKIKAVVSPVKLLLTEESKKKTHWGVVFTKGEDFYGR